MGINLGLEPGYFIQKVARRACAGQTFPQCGKFRPHAREAEVLAVSSQPPLQILWCTSTSRPSRAPTCLSPFLSLLFLVLLLHVLSCLAIALVATTAKLWGLVGRA